MQEESLRAICQLKKGSVSTENIASVEDSEFLFPLLSTEVFVFF